MAFGNRWAPCLAWLALGGCAAAPTLVERTIDGARVTGPVMEPWSVGAVLELELAHSDVERARAAVRAVQIGDAFVTARCVALAGDVPAVLEAARALRDRCEVATELAIRDRPADLTERLVELAATCDYAARPAAERLLASHRAGAAVALLDGLGERGRALRELRERAVAELPDADAIADALRASPGSAGKGAVLARVVERDATVAGQVVRTLGPDLPWEDAEPWLDRLPHADAVAYLAVARLPSVHERLRAGRLALSLGAPSLAVELVTPVPAEASTLRAATLASAATALGRPELARGTDASLAPGTTGRLALDPP